ncbi:Actin cytoskeleton-regulatory complex protein END3 [Hanseniaspora osmophila]|uniref:Actin cytoskeleton-regulatory complex protein END3 n=1 Tax=Hanseniaspora osmophila TaxID=56408 RepID=A0A1E5RNT8_9ASCO|nr:Actin cytoskeleton-regulatory complex protein END3 [Hanseniaspora osmophila]
MPKLEQFEIKKYWQIFSGLKPKDNKFLSYDQVKPILFNSKLDSSVISQIWNISDIDDDDCLDFEEFVICMRLIFDLVNKTISEVPKRLPEWLIPGSKVGLLKEKEKEYTNEQPQSEPASAPERTSPSQVTTSAESVQEASQSSRPAQQLQESKKEEEPEEERPDVDWYISPQDKGLYETLYNTSTLNMDGTISFPSLVNKLKYTILISNINNIQEMDMIKVWNLCNPSKHESIDKDPTLYFMHIIKQMNDKNCKIPVEVPESLKKSFSKDQVETNINSKQSIVKKTPIYSTSVSGNSSTVSSSSKKLRDGTDFSTTENTDWEIVRLKRELNVLDAEYDSVMQTSMSLTQGDQNLKTLKEQFKGLLHHEQKKIINQSESKGTSQQNAKLIDDELDNIEEQLHVLEDYLGSRKDVLNTINQELATF